MTTKAKFSHLRKLNRGSMLQISEVFLFYNTRRTVQLGETQYWLQPIKCLMQHNIQWNSIQCSVFLMVVLCGVEWSA